MKEHLKIPTRHWVRAEQPAGMPPQAWCFTCEWEWEASSDDEDLAHAAAAALQHRRDSSGRAERR